MVSGTRVLAAFAVFVLVAFSGLLAGEAATAKVKKPKLKTGTYSQTFTNGTSMWQDDTGITVFTRSRKVVEVWVTSNYKFNGGKRCWPTGFTGTLMPDHSLTGPVWTTIKPKKPVALNSKQRFRIPATKGNPFGENDGGSIRGRLITAKKMTVTARLAQAANQIQGRCSTSIAAPRARFRPL